MSIYYNDGYPSKERPVAARADRGYEILVRGFQTKEQAREFLSWFSGPGEQSAEKWFGANSDRTFETSQKTFPARFKGNRTFLELK